MQIRGLTPGDEATSSPWTEHGGGGGANQPSAPYDHWKGHLRSRIPHGTSRGLSCNCISSQCTPLITGSLQKHGFLTPSVQSSIQFWSAQPETHGEGSTFISNNSTCPLISPHVIPQPFYVAGKGTSDSFYVKTQGAEPEVAAHPMLAGRHTAHPAADSYSGPVTLALH